MTRCFMLIIVCMIILVPLLAQTTEKLILVDLEQVRDLESFTRLKLPIHHKYLNYLFCIANDQQIQKLDQAYFKVLDNNAWSESYYLLFSKPGRKTNSRISRGTILWQNENQIFLKTSADSPTIIAETGYSTVPISRIPSYYNQTNLVLHPSHRNSHNDIMSMVAQVNPDTISYYISTLQNFQTRFALADTRDAIADWIASQFRDMGYQDVVIDSFFVLNTWQKNVIATLPGSTNPEQNVIIGGHSDDRISFGNTDQFVFCPGADDNASGVAAVLESARVLKFMGYQPNCTFRFVTFACEELGSIGSYYFISDVIADSSQIKLMINHDMIANNPDYPSDKRVLLMPYSGFDAYTSFASNIITTYTDLIPVLGGVDSPASDSYFFSEFNYPPIYFSEYTFSPVYHSAQDVISLLDMNYCAEVIRGSIATGVTVSRGPEPLPDFTVRDTGLGNSLILNWHASADLTIDSYTIHLGTESGVYSQIFTTQDTVYTLEQLHENTLYYIGLSCHNIIGYDSFVIEKTATPGIVPLMPRQLTAYPQMHSIRLSWANNLETDLEGYHIFRSTVPGVFSKDLATIHGNTAEYIDNTTEDGVMYYYSLKAVDSSGNLSPETEQTRSCCVSLNKGILVINEYADSPVVDFLHPTAVQSEMYFDALLTSFRHKNFDFTFSPEIKLADMGPFSTVIWHCDSPVGVTFSENDREELKKYLQFGGNILISSYRPSSMLEQNSSYHTPFHEGEFIFDTFKIAAVDFADSALFKYAVSYSIGLSDLTVDRLKASNLLNYHLQNIETLRATPLGEEVLFYGSHYPPDTQQGTLVGGAVGVGYFGIDYKTVILTFPLWNIELTQAKEFLGRILSTKFSEFSNPTEINNTVLPNIGKLRNYPNPFNQLTNVSFSVLEKSVIDMSIYNLKGQKVRVLAHNQFTPGEYSIRWDGKDNQGVSVGSGIYILKFKESHKTYSIKMLLLK